MNAELLEFANLGNKTAYNPTVPFNFDRKKYMGIRVEPADNEFNSRTFFAYERDDKKPLWEIDYSIEPLNLQDPAYAAIGKNVVISGVRVFNEKDRVSWKQDIYIGDSIKNLEYLVSGPLGMKDIRFIDLKDRVGVFTRPRGGRFGLGRVGYFEVKDIEELKKLGRDDWYEMSFILDNLFSSDQWGGVNYALHSGKENIGVIGHLAFHSIEKNKTLKHYYGISFLFNAKQKKFSKPKIIARRKDFPKAPSKKSPELDDIVFPAGIDASTNEIYCGLSDFCIGKKKINKLF